MAFPRDDLDLHQEVWLGGVWVDLVDDGQVRYAEQISIARAARTGDSTQVDHGRANFTLDNRDGRWSSRNPLSPYYGLLTRNTLTRTYVGRASVGATGGSATASTSHVAPSVDSATTSALLLCAWVGDTTGNYTLPGGMTAGPAETDGAFSTMRTASQAISATGATGTRTATFSASRSYASASVLLHGTGLVVQQTASGISDTLGDVTFTLGSGTQVGWWVVAFQAWDLASGSEVWPDAPIGSGWVPLARLNSFAAGGSVISLRASARRITTAGTQTVTLLGGKESTAIGNHAAAFVVSGVDWFTPRFAGEVPEWPVRWNPAGTDVRTPVEAAGILRRLGQNTPLLGSAIRRFLLEQSPAAYWPMEDGPLATVGRSALTDGSPLRPFTGNHPSGAAITFPQFGRGELAPWLPAGLSRSGALGFTVLYGNIPAVTTSSWTVSFLYNSGIDAGDTVLDINPLYLGGATGWPQLLILPSVQGVDVTFNAEAEDSATVAHLFDGHLHHVQIDAFQSGANIGWNVYVDGVSVNAGTTAGAATLPRLDTVALLVDAVAGTQVAHGHLAVWTTHSPGDLQDTVAAAFGWAGETAGRRIQRLCDEHDVRVHLVDHPDDTAPLGPQRFGLDVLTLLREAADVDGGVLYEPREELGLAYRSRGSVYNQPAGVELTYTAPGEVMPPLEPTDDDRHLVNDVTAYRVDGDYARHLVTSGPLSYRQPPDGAGLYPTQVTLNVWADNQLPDLAAWRAHLGTWDEARYPRVALSMTALGNAGKQTLIEAVAALDVRDRLSIDDPPPWLPPETISVLVDGSTETLGPNDWTLDLNCSPAGPFVVGVVEDEVLGRADTDGSALAGDFDAGTDTSMSVFVTTGPLWITTASHPAEFPFHVKAGGVVLNVTAISGGGSPQTFTVTQTPVNGVEKTIPAGTALSLANPMRVAL